MKRIILLTIFIIATILGACGGTDSQEVEEDNVLIYTSIYPLQFLIEQLTQDVATVESIYPPGVDAHTYEPTSKEITEIARADMFFYLGANMESFSETIKRALENETIEFIELGQHKELFIESKYDHHHDHGHHETPHHNEHENHHHDIHHADLDPHIWLDPLRMVQLAEIIVDELITFDAENETMYKENFAQLEEQLLALHEQFSTTLQQKDHKQIIVSHAAYGYWEERYGLEQVPISGVTSSDEPSQKELVNIAKFAEETGTSFIVVDQMGANRLTVAIQEYIGAELKTIHHLETLTEEDIENKETYFTIMEQNIATLDEILD